MEFFEDPEFWVAVALLIFIGAMAYYKVHSLVADSLDMRARQIADQLDEARRLREEAQTLLASYERKQRNAAREAEEIVSLAREEAERIAAENEAKLADLMERRTRQARERIAQTEAQAMRQVRATSADIAIDVARRLIEQTLDEGKRVEMAGKAIADLEKNIH